MPVAQIVDQYRDGIFTSPNPYDREQIIVDEIANYPMFTEEGDEIPLYSEDGFRIQRRIARFSRNTPPHATLINFQQLHTLFVNEEDDLDMAEEHPRHTPFTVYPQAGLKTAGHFQAKGLMTPCYKLVDRVNQALAAQANNDDDDDNVDMDWQPIDRPAICGIASQGYNNVMHHTRGRRAQHHDAQLGLVTSTLAGGWATTPKSKQQAGVLAVKCQHSLPHKTFAAKIMNPSLQRDLRLENVYSIDLHVLRRRQRTGSYVYSML